VSAQVVSVLLGRWAEAIPAPAYLHRQTGTVTHENDLELFLANLSSLDLAAASPGML